MALAAICPHCQTMFRVASDQLKLRGGIVRCGACHEVFDGNAALVDLDAIPVQEPQAALAPAEAAQAAVAPGAGPGQAQAEELSEEVDTNADVAIGALPVLNSVVEDRRDVGDAGDALIAEPAPDALLHEEPPSRVDTEAPPATADLAPDVQAAADTIEYTLDFDTTLGDETRVAAADAAAADDAVRAEADEHLVALPPPVDGDEDVDGAPDAPVPVPAPREPPARPPAPGAADSLAPLLMRASAAAEDRPGPPTVLPAGQQALARSRRAKAAAERKQAAVAAPEVVAAPEPPPDDEPEFVRRSRQREQSGERTRMLLVGGCVVLALALLVQGVWSFRNTLAARYPGARPLLGGLCAVMGCKVELPAQIDALAVETGELQTLDASTFSLVTLLRNQGDLVQAWPHLELALTDANDKTLVRRVFTPADYLPPGALAARGFAARSEQSIKLTFQLDQVKASGYHLAIFYP